MTSRSPTPAVDAPVLAGLDLTVPAGTSLAIVGQNGAGKTTLAKLLCRLYDPDDGAIKVDGVDLRQLDLAAGGAASPRSSRTSSASSSPCARMSTPAGRPAMTTFGQHCADAGAENLAELDTPLAKGYSDGIDLSGGQWQRVALARALCAVRRGAGLVLLDEPTAQLDVRGEAEVFDRVLQATREATTILISHRFSTVRHADRICVLEHGRVVELGSHDELMARGGRYKTMFELQAKRFEATMDEEGSCSMSSDPTADQPSRDRHSPSRRAAASALIDVAAVQARLHPRAAAGRRGGHAHPAPGRARTRCSRCG